MLEFSILKINFKNDRAEVLLNCPTLEDNERVLFSNKIIKSIPEIAEHYCKNNFGTCFCDCIFTTGVAHIFEHILLEMLYKSQRKQQNEKFCAVTRKYDQNIAKIEISYYDDIELLKAVKHSLNIANKCINEALCDKN